MSNEKPHSRWLVAATILFYMFAALSYTGYVVQMVMVNKWVLNTTTTPLFFLLAQLLIAVVLFIFTNAVGLFKVPLKPDARKCKGLLPMALINVIGLSSNNYCLKYVDASFYQIARGLVLPLTVIFSVLFLRNSRPSVRIFIACGAVTVGFFVGVFLDGSHNSRTNSKGPSFLGIFFGILSSMTTAAHAIVIKKSLDVVNGDALELSWYSNILSSVLLLPLIVLAGEVPDILAFISTPAFSSSTSNSPLATFLWGSLITGIVGWLLSIAGVLSIKITSPITHMISSAVRGIVQSFMGMYFFGDIITVGRGSSIGIILGGSCYYTWVKNEEFVAKREFEANGGSAMRDLERGSGKNGYTPVPMEDSRKSSDIDLDEAIRELEGKNGGSKPKHSKHGDEA